MDCVFSRKLNIQADAVGLKKRFHDNKSYGILDVKPVLCVAYLY
jgi:hypothetical protein